MMMERPRPSEEEGETTEVVKPTEPVSDPAPPAPVEEKVLPADPEEAIEALEQRLELLGGSTEAAEPAAAAPELVATEDEKEEEDKPVAAPAAAPAPVAAPAPAPAPVVTAPAPPPASAPAPVVSAPAPTAKPAQQQAAAGGKSALLARIIASQERARAAEEKSRAFEQELNRPKGQQPPAPAPAPPRSAAEEQEKILKALSGETEETKKAADEPPPPPFEVAEAGMKKANDNGSLLDLPPPFEVAAQTMAPPSFASVENTLPPPFEAVEKSAASKQVKFDASTKQAPTPTVPAPSAPTFDPHEVTAAPAPAASDADFSFLQEGIERVVPPPSSTSEAPPPSFEQFEAANSNQAAASELDEGAFEFDLDGNPLSPEERKKMMAEQRAIMEEIQREAALNAKAIAAAQADNFDQRSGSAAVRAVDSGPSRPARAERGAAVAPAGSAAAAATEEEGAADGERTVEIGGGQNVALHGQEKTKQAIADGTAILVQCVNCQNWMQVTESATLMFCPVCSVVSPVTKQDEVMTKEEAIQLTMDRKLAEQLQAEINAEAAEDGPRRSSQRSGSAQQPRQEEEGYMAAALRKLRGEEAPAASERLIPGSSGGQSHGSRPGEKSWWDTFSEYVGVGVTEGADERRAGEISVSRPPGAGPASASARTSSEQRGLLASVDGHGSSAVAPVRDSAPVGIGSHRPPAMQSARVAESKPLFSCVVDSMSSAASAVGTAINQNVLGDGEDIRGVDNNSLLSVTQVGRGQGGSGSYHQLESNGNL